MMVNTQQAKPVRTRKRLADDRIAELLDVAAEVFIAQGFAAASTNEIARLANASKTTFYSRFPTKEDLFLAVIERKMTNVFERVAKFPPQPPLEKTLRNFCRNLLKIALSPEQIALIRMVSMEARRYPALATRYYENGPGKAEAALAAYLAGQVEKRALSGEDPVLMARQFMNLTTGGPVRWFVLGLDAKRLSGRALQRHVEDTVRFFLRAYRPE